MRFSTRGRHAVMLMVDLARNERGKPVALAEIAARQRVSQSYLEQLVAHLKSRNMVKSTRGPGGGYALRAPADSMTVHDIVRAVDEAEPRVPFVNSLTASSRELTDLLWQAIDDEITRYLRKITLADVCRYDLSDFLSKANGKDWEEAAESAISGIGEDDTDDRVRPVPLYGSMAQIA